MQQQKSTFNTQQKLTSHEEARAKILARTISLTTQQNNQKTSQITVHLFQRKPAP